MVCIAAPFPEERLRWPNQNRNDLVPLSPISPFPHFHHTINSWLRTSDLCHSAQVTHATHALVKNLRLFLMHPVCWRKFFWNLALQGLWSDTKKSNTVSPLIKKHLSLIKEVWEGITSVSFSTFFAEVQAVLFSCQHFGWPKALGLYKSWCLSVRMSENQQAAAGQSEC